MQRVKLNNKHVVREQRVELSALRVCDTTSESNLRCQRSPLSVVTLVALMVKNLTPSPSASRSSNDVHCPLIVCACPGSSWNVTSRSSPCPSPFVCTCIEKSTTSARDSCNSWKRVCAYKPTVTYRPSYSTVMPSSSYAEDQLLFR